MPNRLVIWVEGDRDQRFFESVIKPRLAPMYDQVLVREYRQRKTPAFNKLLIAMPHQGFGRLFIADMNSAPCVTGRKTRLRERHHALNDDEIVIVSKEIESWYLAGLTAEGKSALKISLPNATDRLTKEDLEALRPRRFDSQLDFLIELLKYFDITTACSRNQSFAYFCRKLGL